MPTTRPAGTTFFGDRTSPQTSTDGQLGPLRSEYEAMMLQTLYDTNPYVMLASGEYANLIAGGADTAIAQWVDYEEFPDAGKLQEGITPNPTPVKRRVIQKLVEEYGQSVILTSRELARSMHGLPAVVVERLTESFMSTNNKAANDAIFLTVAPTSANSAENLYPSSATGNNGNIATSTDKENTVNPANVRYGKGAASYGALTTDSNGAGFTLADIRFMGERLRDTNVLPMEQPVYATDGVDTTPRPKSYWGIVDSVGKEILFSLTEGTGADKVYNFVHAHNYSDARVALDNELGSTYNIRWLYDTNEAWAGGSGTGGVTKGTGRRLSIHGMGALGMAAITPENFRIVSYSGASAADALAQTQGIGWRGSFAWSLLSGGDRSAQLWYVT